VSRLVSPVPGSLVSKFVSQYGRRPAGFRPERLCTRQLVSSSRRCRPTAVLSAWEAAPSGPATDPGLRGGLSASGHERPLVTGVYGTLMARRTAVPPALIAVPCSSPALLDSCRPSGRGRRVNAREATACGLALTRRTRPRESSSEEDARRLHPLRPEAGMPDVVLPEKRRSAVRPCPEPSVFDSFLVL